ncbi:DUF6264 family protein [Frigoribacterium sp. 2-23]|uniref:DUF6264 family protein n=1 Tax=Frigoribacterium sp. 2-23 TaxID=3415006 RepID=UPI003C6FD173
MTDDRPKPRYGEYAPEGWVNPAAPVEPPAEEAPAPSPGGYPTQYQPYQGADQKSPVPGAPVGPNGVPVLSTGRRVDRIVSLVLLGFAAYNTISSLFLAPSYASSLLQRLRQLGYPTDDFSNQSALQAAGAFFAVFAVVLFALTAWWSIRRLRTARITFWVPLTAGVLFAIVQGITVGAIMLGDPAFTSSILGTQG